MIYKINGNYVFFSSYNGLSSTACFGGHQGRESGTACLESVGGSLVLAYFWRDVMRNGLASHHGLWVGKLALNEYF